MTAMTKQERVRAALSGQAVDRPPVSLWGHDFLREWDPADLAAVTVEQYRAHDWDFIKFNPRATYFSEAWGNRFERPTEQRQPRLIEAAVEDADALRRIEAIDPKGGVFGEHITALRLVLAEVVGEVDVVHTIFSALGVAGALCRGDAKFREYASVNPSAAHAALAALNSTLSDYAVASIRAGAAGIFYAPLRWASRDTCNEEFYREFGRPYDLQLLARVQGAPFNILHVCGNHNMIDLLLDYPVPVVNWADRGEGNPGLSDVKERTEKAVMGGVDHTRLHEASVEEVAGQARDALGAGPERLFVTGGCAIRPQTPATNRQAVTRAVRGD